MDLQWTAEDIAFLDEVRRVLDEHLTDDLRRAGTLMTSVYAEREGSLAWQKILHAKGWAAPAWPVEHGGAGWSVAALSPPITPFRDAWRMPGSGSPHWKPMSSER